MYQNPEFLLHGIPSPSIHPRGGNLGSRGELKGLLYFRTSILVGGYFKSLEIWRFKYPMDDTILFSFNLKNIYIEIDKNNRF